MVSSVDLCFFMTLLFRISFCLPNQTLILPAAPTEGERKRNHHLQEQPVSFSHLGCGFMCIMIHDSFFLSEKECERKVCEEESQSVVEA